MSINRVAFTIFGLPIYWYGLLIALGLGLALLCGMKRERAAGLPQDSFVDYILIGLPVGVICARIYYVIFSWDMYAGNLLAIFNVRQGGLAIYGGVIGGVLTAVIYCRKRKISFGALADVCAPALALAQAIGRWGNFVNQEAYGIAITNELLQFFPLAVFIQADGLWHAATFFYESAWCFIIHIVLIILEQKRALKRKGDLFCAYVFLYAAERAVVEGLRLDSLYMGAIRVSQLLSGAAMLGVALYFALRKKDVTNK